MAYIPKWTSSTGKTYATTVDEGRGNWEKMYLNPSTSADQAKSLYANYGARYGWMPLNERLSSAFGQSTTTPTTPPATAPTAATPAVAAPTVAAPKPITPANQKEVYPYLTSGIKPSTPTAPKFDFNSNNQPVKSLSYYIPKIETSPTFAYQADEAQRALAQKMAAQGLTGSGAALELSRRTYNDLLKNEADRAYDMGKIDQQNASNNYQNSLNKYAHDINLFNSQSGLTSDAWKLREQEADRLSNAQTAESLRGERESNTYWQRLMDLVSTLQAANPLGTAASASKSLADIYTGMAPQMVSYLSQSR